MFTYYLRLSLRHLWKYKTSTVINLLGLTTAMCVCFFALSYVKLETGYDDYHEKSERIYRLVTDVESPSGISYESTPAPLGPAVQDVFPEIEAFTRVMLDYMMVRKDLEHSGEEQVAYADPSLFSIFTLPLVQGNPQAALEAPLQIVLSESAARKYFGTTDCLGKTLILDKDDLATVSGVMKDMPQNSHFRVDILISMSTLLQEWNPGMTQNWNRFGFYTYLLLPDRYPASSLDAKFAGFARERMNHQDVTYTLSLESLESVYLYGKPRGHRAGSSASGNISNVYIFSIVALLVLFIATFNFINMTLAISRYRVQEVGVRKILGASGKQLFSGFLTDALLLCLAAFVLAFLCSTFLIPLVNQVSGKVIAVSIFGGMDILGLLLCVALLTALITGLYPAISLAGFQPVHHLRAAFIPGASPVGLRKALVIAQFSISIILIAATLVIFRQLNFMQNHELGFRKDHLLVVDYFFDTRITRNIEAIRQQFTGISGVEAVTISSSIPGKDSHVLPVSFENSHHEMQETRTNTYSIDHRFLSIWQIPTIAGRPFSPFLASDSTQSIMLNESAVKSLGYSHPDSVIGKHFRQAGEEGRITGVVRDFHFDSFREQVRPLAFRMGLDSRFTFMTFDISSEDIGHTVAEIRNKWNEQWPDRPITYFFADDAYDELYHQEERFGKLFTALSLIAIALSCLGLYGLVALRTFERVKEIGIRKVLGASASSVVALLTKDFIRLVLIAIVIATPIAWFVLYRWLQGFAYRMELQWWMFALAGLATIVVALITVSTQSVRAALANPVTAIQSD